MKYSQPSDLQITTPRFLLNSPHIFIVFIFLFNGFYIMAQETTSHDPSIIDDEMCGTPPPEELDPPGVYSRSIDPEYLKNFDPVSFNIFFWGIAKNDGTWNGPPMTLQKAQDAVTLLNEHFGPFNICFNLVGMDIISSDEYHDGKGLSAIWSFANQHGYVKANSFNVYSPNTLSGGTGMASYYNPRVAIRTCCIVHPSFVHEIGHSFNLYHTFGPNNVGPDPLNCERVTRDVNHQDYNATSAGDEVHDTNAVPNFFREQHNYVAYAVEQANIGYTWNTARTDIAFSPNGFNSFPDAAAIEQALMDYGFTSDEINHLKFNPAKDYAYSDLNNETYDPDNRINDANSPFFKDCKGSPYQITTTDIKNLMAYSYSSSKKFTIGQGIRMHEAINNDIIRPSTQLPYNVHLVAAMTQHPFDLYIRDHLEDIGQEPNIHTEVFWNSPDIWVRNYADGVQTHQNPNYNLNPNYVYVRVSNKGCLPSTGEETLKLYWAKANTSLLWDLHWNGTLFVNGVLMGDTFATLNIPIIEPGEEIILEAPWFVPNPEDYKGFNEDPWHFCLLARIESEDDPMAVSEVAFLPHNVKNNNNIAWKNTTVIPLTQSGTNLQPGGAVAIGNMGSENVQTFDFNFFSTELDSAIFEEAEVLITLSPDAFSRWISGGNQAENIEIYNEEEGELIITGNHARLLNMQYDPDEWDILYLSFNFLTEEVTGKEIFEYHLVQKDTEGEAMGGEVYQIIRDPDRPHFVADGDSYENTFGETEMTATDIGEPAVYNWYGPEGELIHSGKDFIFIPDVPGDYLLEVIAVTDGHKDYFKLTIAVNATQNQIISLSPNPATNIVSVEYQINQNATTASLTVASFFGNTQNNYAVDLANSNTKTNINLAGYPAGYYAVILMVDGQAVHAKQLIIN